MSAPVSKVGGINIGSLFDDVNKSIDDIKRREETTSQEIKRIIDEIIAKIDSIDISENYANIGKEIYDFQTDIIRKSDSIKEKVSKNKQSIIGIETKLNSMKGGSNIDTLYQNTLKEINDKLNESNIVLKEGSTKIEELKGIINRVNDENTKLGEGIKELTDSVEENTEKIKTELDKITVNKIDLEPVNKKIVEIISKLDIYNTLSQKDIVYSYLANNINSSNINEFYSVLDMWINDDNDKEIARKYFNDVVFNKLLEEPTNKVIVDNIKTLIGYPITGGFIDTGIINSDLDESKTKLDTISNDLDSISRKIEEDKNKNNELEKEISDIIDLLVYDFSKDTTKDNLYNDVRNIDFNKKIIINKIIKYIEKYNNNDENKKILIYKIHKLFKKIIKNFSHLGQINDIIDNNNYEKETFRVILDEIDTANLASLYKVKLATSISGFLTNFINSIANEFALTDYITANKSTLITKVEDACRGIEREKERDKINRLQYEIDIIKLKNEIKDALDDKNLVSNYSNPTKYQEFKKVLQICSEPA